MKFISLAFIFSIAIQFYAVFAYSAKYKLNDDFESRAKKTLKVLFGKNEAISIEKKGAFDVQLKRCIDKEIQRINHNCKDKPGQQEFRDFLSVIIVEKEWERLSGASSINDFSNLPPEEQHNYVSVTMSNFKNNLDDFHANASVDDYARAAFNASTVSINNTMSQIAIVDTKSDNSTLNKEILDAFLSNSYENLATFLGEKCNVDTPVSRDMLFEHADSENKGMQAFNITVNLLKTSVSEKLAQRNVNETDINDYFSTTRIAITNTGLVSVSRESLGENSKQIGISKSEKVSIDDNNEGGIPSTDGSTSLTESNKSSFPLSPMVIGLIGLIAIAACIFAYFRNRNCKKIRHNDNDYEFE